MGSHRVAPGLQPTHHPLTYEALQAPHAHRQAGHESRARLSVGTEYESKTPRTESSRYGGILHARKADMATNKGRQNYKVQKIIKDLKAGGANVCHLCGCAIDMRLTSPDPLSWSLDHLQPLSKGGIVDDPANARESHLDCNRRRQDQDID